MANALLTLPNFYDAQIYEGQDPELEHFLEDCDWLWNLDNIGVLLLDSIREVDQERISLLLKKLSD